MNDVFLKFILVGFNIILFHYLQEKLFLMQTKWKVKNVKSVNETIRCNEKEITRINNYMNDYFATDAERIKMISDIHALESENERLQRLEPSNLSPDEIISLTESNLPPLVGHRKKKQGSLTKIPFIDNTVESSSKMRKAVWELVLNEWKYLRYE